MDPVQFLLFFISRLTDASKAAAQAHAEGRVMTKAERDAFFVTDDESRAKFVADIERAEAEGR